LILMSNNGMDQKDKTLNNARSKHMKRPILVEIQSDITKYKYPKLSLTVHEAKEARDALTKMIDYLEEV